MKTFAIRIKLSIMISILIMLLGVLGCGVAITQQSAQQAVTDAQVAVSDARISRAPLYSTDKMKRGAEWTIQHPLYRLSSLERDQTSGDNVPRSSSSEAC